MPVIKDIKRLHPHLVEYYTEAKAAFVRDFPKKSKPQLSETARQDAVQRAYYARGRESVAEVRRLYAAAGLYVPTLQECKEKNTNANVGQSAHASDPSHAFDVVFVKPNGDRDNTEALYIIFGGYMIAAARKICAAAGRPYDLRWGHDWNGDGINNQQFYDNPHFEIKGWEKLKHTPVV
jgi:hypothetical protein